MEPTARGEFELQLRIQHLEDKLAYLAGGTNGEELASIIMEKDQELQRLVRSMHCCGCCLLWQFSICDCTHLPLLIVSLLRATTVAIARF